MSGTRPTRPFKQVDVFTQEPGYGNPVAVIMAAEGLSTEAMQRMARWTNLSETTFITASDKADYHLRIFCPGGEMPFAGHPTIGSAHAALEAGLADPKGGFTMECGLGVLNLWQEEGRTWVRVPSPVLKQDEINSRELADCIGGRQPKDPAIFDTGAVWLTGELDSVADLRETIIDIPRLNAFTAKFDSNPGLLLYVHTEEGGLEVRAFHPLAGVDEDPVCGSGNLCAAAHLKAFGGMARSGARYQARQGMNMDRNGRLELKILEDGLELGGAAVTVFEGTAHY